MYGGIWKTQALSAILTNTIHPLGSGSFSSLEFSNQASHTGQRVTGILLSPLPSTGITNACHKPGIFIMVLMNQIQGFVLARQAFY